MGEHDCTSFYCRISIKFYNYKRVLVEHPICSIIIKEAFTRIRNAISNRKQLQLLIKRTSDRLLQRVKGGHLDIWEKTRDLANSFEGIRTRVALCFISISMTIMMSHLFGGFSFLWSIKLPEQIHDLLINPSNLSHFL